MNNYIEVYLSDDIDTKLHNINAVVSAIHDINSLTPHSLALTFESDADFSDVASIKKVGIVATQSKILTHERIDTLCNACELEKSKIKRFQGTEPLVRFGLLKGVGLKGNLNQIKKRAKKRSIYLAKKGMPKSPFAIEAEMLKKAIEKEKTESFLEIKQLSYSQNKVIHLKVSKCTVGTLSKSVGPNIYGLKTGVRLMTS